MITLRAICTGDKALAYEIAGESPILFILHDMHRKRELYDFLKIGMV